MTSLEWVYEPADDADKQLRASAMNFAKLHLAGKIPKTRVATDLEKEALAIRRSEMTWGDFGQMGAEPPPVKIAMGTVYWGVLLAQLTVAVIGALLYLASK